MLKGVIFDIQRFSIHDGPGIRTTVFFKGCSLSCKWCHNPESQATDPVLMYRETRCIRCGACIADCPAEAISMIGDRVLTDPARCQVCGSCVEMCNPGAREIVGREMSVDQILDQVRRDEPFYARSGGGVTFSGGEPLSQPELLLELLRACGEIGLHRAVDTCGFAPWATCDSIRPYTDLWLFDLKLMDDSKHRRFCGVSNKTIQANLRQLSDLGQRIILRVPVIPGITDDIVNIQQIGSFAASLSQVERIDLLPYHRMASEKYERLGRDYSLETMLTPSEDIMAELQAILEGFGLQVQIGG